MAAHMRALRVHSPGQQNSVQVEMVPVPKPKADEILVRVEYAGVNMVDTYWRKGLPGYEGSGAPFVLGMEGGGTIAEVGNEVDGFAIDDRVVAVMHLGAFAEFWAVPSRKAVQVPTETSMRDAVAVALQGLTAEFLTSRTFPVSRGNHVLLHAAAGGVGAYVASFASRRGAHVIGTCSSVEKRERALRCGCAEVIVGYDREGFVDGVQHFTGGEGVHVVYDSVGKSTFYDSLRCLLPCGMVVLFGQSSGPVSNFDPQLLRTHGSLFLTRPSLSDYIVNRGDFNEMAKRLFGALQLDPTPLEIAAELSLDGIDGFHAQMSQRLTSGKGIVRLTS
jgi:NADPH:quinone reductase